MPRARFYNRRSRHEHPRKHPIWRLPAERRGKPADVRHRDRSSAIGFRLLPWCGAGPPCGHPTSNSLALDGATTGFRSLDSLLPTVMPDSPRCHAEGEAPRLCRPKVPLSNRTLWHLSLLTGRGPREQTLLQTGDLTSAGSTSMLPAFLRSRSLPSHETCTSALSSSREERLHPLAGGRSCRTFSSRFENRD